MAADRAGRRAAGLLVLASLLVLPACSTDGADAPRDTPSAAAPAPPPGDVDAALPAPPPAATDDPASEQAALDAGAAAVVAFARPDLTAEQWWSELRPLLSAAAIEAYAGTDPAEVPARTVTGPPWRGESDSPYLALTFVPTDAGDYAVLLVRDGGGTPWLVERITLVPADATSAPAPTAGDQES